MKRRLGLILAVAAVLIGAALLAGAALLLAGGNGEEPSAPTERETTGELGARAPNLRGLGVPSGEEIALADFAGERVVINVWASWCGPCEREVPMLVRFARAHEGVRLLGIATQDTAADANVYYDRWRLAHPSILDPNGEKAAELGVTTLPETIVLNRDHFIVARIQGPATASELENAVADAGM